MEDSALVTVPLHVLAHSRAGDKGDRLNVSLISYEDKYFSYLAEQVTEEAVKGLFNFRGVSSVRIYKLSHLSAMNIVIDGALEGGVNNSLCLDGHGKSLSFFLLSLPIKIPSNLLPNIQPPPKRSK